MNVVIRDKILERLNIKHPVLIGEGVEAWVYALDDDRVMRICKQGGHVVREGLMKMRDFYDALDSSEEGIALPKTFSVNELDGVIYAIDQRLKGEQLAKLLVIFPEEECHRMLKSYLDVVSHISGFHSSFDFFGEVLSPRPLRCESWAEFINTKVRQSYDSAAVLFDQEVSDMQAILAFIKEELSLVADVTTPVLVHGDYNAMNVLADSSGKISALTDFGTLTLGGDPRMDLTSGVIGFLEAEDGLRPEDGKFLMECIVDQYGEGILRITHLYRVYYAICFASYCKETDPRTYAWSMRTLREHLDGSYLY
jgi:aminoglycoside phosphotransferase (APT) family kinase protein